MSERAYKPRERLWLISARGEPKPLAYAAKELARRLHSWAVAGPADDPGFWRSRPRPEAVALHGLSASEAQPLLASLPEAPPLIEIPDWGWLSADPPPVEACRERLRGWLAGSSEGALAVDVPGLVWLGLSLRHEALSSVRDEHARPAAEANLFFPPDLRGTPLVDRAAADLLARLPAAFREAEPFLPRCPRLTFDVDSLALFPGWRSVAGALKRRDWRCLKRWREIRSGREPDPHLQALERFVEALREAAIPSAWFWMAARRYRLDPPPYLRTEAFRRAREALSDLAVHGLHPSYRAGERTEWLVEEKRLAEEALGQGIASSRFHYLRWDHWRSPGMLAEAGLLVDSTLGFPNFAGFRAGTAVQFELVDQRTLERINVHEIPLAFLDSGHLFHERRALAELPEALEAILGAAGVPGSSEAAVLLHPHNFADAGPEAVRAAVEALRNAGAAPFPSQPLRANRKEKPGAG